MKRLFTVLAMALMLLVLVWGQAVPVRADEGDDHPWSGDDNNSGTGQYRYERSDLFFATGIFTVDLLFSSQLLFDDFDLSQQSNKPSSRISNDKERDTYTDRIKKASIK